MGSYEKLRERIEEKYGTRAAFAKVLRYSGHNVVNNRLRGATLFNVEDIKTWSDALDIPRDQIADYFMPLSKPSNKTLIDVH